MNADTMPQVDGLHDLAERLEQTGIPAGTVAVRIHPEHWDTTDAGERLADGLGLTYRHDYAADPGGNHGAFTAWSGRYDGIDVTVFGATPERGDR